MMKTLKTLLWPTATDSHPHLSSRIIRLLAASTAVSCSLSIGHAAAPSFHGLGDLPGGIFQSKADAVSADGSVIVGLANSAAGIEAFRWTAATGMVGLGGLPGATPIDSRAFGVSADGTAVVGGDGHGGAFRWTQSTGMVFLGDLPGGPFSSAANDASADGAVVAGTGVPEQGFESFRWTQSTGMVAIRGIVTDGTTSATRAISDDGSVIVGFYDSNAGIIQPSRWSDAGGFQTLDNLPGAIYGEARSVSADGQVVVGFSGPQAFRWTAADGTIGLDDLPGGPVDSKAHSVSADGSIIVGYGTSASGLHEATIWDAVHGVRSLQEVLINEYGLGAELAGWTLGSNSIFPGPDGSIGALGISNDGKTIVGWGVNPDGNLEAWVATVPEPSSIMLGAAATVGLLGLAVRRRRLQVG